jgi:hypothetical protein
VENHFPRNFPQNFFGKQCFETFSAVNFNFPQHFWGKIFRGIFLGIFRGKNVQKIGGSEASFIKRG